MRNGHVDDSSHLWNVIHDYICLDMEFKPHFMDNQKADCGFQHPIVTCLLCPADHVDEFDANPEK